MYKIVVDYTPRLVLGEGLMFRANISVMGLCEDCKIFPFIGDGFHIYTDCLAVTRSSPYMRDIKLLKEFIKSKYIEEVKAIVKKKRELLFSNSKEEREIYSI